MKQFISDPVRAAVNFIQPIGTSSNRVIYMDCLFRLAAFNWQIHFHIRITLGQSFRIAIDMDLMVPIVLRTEWHSNIFSDKANIRNCHVDETIGDEVKESSYRDRASYRGDGQSCECNWLERKLRVIVDVDVCANADGSAILLLLLSITFTTHHSPVHWDRALEHRMLFMTF